MYYPYQRPLYAIVLGDVELTKEYVAQPYNECIKLIPVEETIAKAYPDTFNDSYGDFNINVIGNYDSLDSLNKALNDKTYRFLQMFNQSKDNDYDRNAFYLSVNILAVGVENKLYTAELKDEIDFSNLIFCKTSGFPDDWEPVEVKLLDSEIKTFTAHQGLWRKLNRDVFASPYAQARSVQRSVGEDWLSSNNAILFSIFKDDNLLKNPDLQFSVFKRKECGPGVKIYGGNKE